MHRWEERVELINIISLFVGGLGVGTLINSYAKNAIEEKRTRRERLYQEKRDAYIGLLEAIHAAAVEPSEKASKNYALWQTKCLIFGSQKVASLATLFADGVPGTHERNEVFEILLLEIKKDIQS